MSSFDLKWIIKEMDRTQKLRSNTIFVSSVHTHASRSKKD